MESEKCRVGRCTVEKMKARWTDPHERRSQQQRSRSILKMTSGSENEDNSDTVSLTCDVSEYADVPTKADYRTAPFVI